MTALYIEPHKWPSLRRIRLKCDSQISSKCLIEWSTRHISYNEKSFHECRNCIRKKYASQGGKAGGRAAVESGQINELIRIAASPKVRKKAYRTARKKGSRAFTSKLEDDVFLHCQKWFGEVKRWQYIKRSDGKNCNVDLYIPSIETFVEVDGRYWHGLDRPYDELSLEIKAKYDHDRLLDEHCNKSGIRLIRLNEDEVRKGDWQSIRSKLESDAVPTSTR